jgi:hypothetical protein
MKTFTVMTSQHSIEKAYTEWVIKACEVVIQSRLRPGMTPNLIVRQSRQFALIFPETRDARSVISNIFNEIIVVRFSRENTTVEEWVFQFEPISEIVPTNRLERRDISLPRRLTVALRALLSLTCILPTIPGDLDFEILPLDETDPTINRVDVCCIPSSCGSLRVHTSASLGVITSPPSCSSTPTVRPVSPVIRIDETFIQTHSLGGIEMVIEVENEPPSSYVEKKLMPRIPSVVSIARTPPRDLTEIWPTSHLSYSSSPRGRSGSFSPSSASSEAECTGSLFNVPHWIDGEEPGPLIIEQYFEKPVPVTCITEFIDQLAKTIK